MSVIATRAIRARLFSGYEDPRYPTGMWTASRAVTGDGTGGDMSVQINFALATELRNSQYYSLEELTIFQGAVGDDIGELLIANFDIGSVPTVGDARVYSLTLLANQAGGGALTPAESLFFQGLMIGRQANPNTATSISFTIDNVDLRVLTMTLGGYVWSARSTAIPGGPQRPPTGIYRS